MILLGYRKNKKKNTQLLRKFKKFYFYFGFFTSMYIFIYKG